MLLFDLIWFVIGRFTSIKYTLPIGMFVCIYVLMYVCVLVYVCMCVHMYICVIVFMYVPRYVCMHGCMYEFIYVFTDYVFMGIWCM